MTTSDHMARRSVLALGASAVGAAVLAGPLGSVAAAAAGPAPSAVAAAGLRRSHWTGLVGRTVTVRTATGSVAATVVRVEDLLGAPKGAADRFSVELRTAKSRASLAGVMPVTIPSRGVVSLLISPSDRGARYRTYQIVVNNPPR